MDEPLLRRIGSALPAILIGSALVVALWLMPDLTPGEAIPVVGQRSDHGRIVESRGTDPTGLPLFAVEVSEGPSAGQLIEAVVQDGSVAVPGSSNREPYEVGDEVVVTSFTGPAAGTFAVISEPWRLPLLGLVVGVFAAAVLVVGGLRGIRSLVALALTLTVVVKVVVPLLLRGFDPILLAVGVAAAVTLATLLLTEGFSRVTLAAVLGTFAALALTAVLAALFTEAAAFTALQGNEEIAFLIPLVGDRIDLNGILLAATVFGALGVLDDVTVTQSATVEQLQRAEPAAGRRG
ncbi:MAG: YibE/F family protein, partial [Candidatus Limnocylindria bacterium]